MTTLSPTVIPTFAPTEADLAPSTLVLGMGVGTLTIIVLSVALAVTWCVSDGCGLNAKAFSRCVSTLIYIVVFLSLIFAPRESKYESILPQTQIYDSSIPIRTSICGIIFFFGLIATLILIKQSNSPIELSTIYHDSHTFWQDE